MMRNAFTWIALVTCCLLLGACKSQDAAAAKPGKWMNYAEITASKEQQLRRMLKVEQRDGMSSAVTDTGEVWYPSEITQYNIYGLPTLSQLMDQSGVVTKETRYEYQDSLVVREYVKESTGYSAALHFKYNEKGQKIEELMFQRGDSALRRTYTLDALGNEIAVDLYKFRDHAFLKLLTTRDAMGRPVDVQEMQNGKANWTEKYAMSDSVWRIKRSDANGTLQSDYEMHFDAQRSISKMVNRDPEGKTRMRVDFTNDAQGRVIQDQFYGAQDQPLQGTRSRYNDQGLLVERILTTPTQTLPIKTKLTYSFRK
jgi:hypothetical protein